MTTDAKVETANPFTELSAEQLASAKAQLAEAESTLRQRTLDSLLTEATAIDTSNRKARLEIVNKFVAIGYRGFGYAIDDNGQVHCVSINKTAKSSSNGDRKASGDLRGTFDASNPPAELLASVLELDREIKAEKDVHKKKLANGKRDAKMRNWCEKQNLSW